ncbi:MAG: HIT domain-containing protein [Rhizobiaceae bacterium]|nr:HIT domain-containing protein [Rhizobiaceae bacterium]
MISDAESACRFCLENNLLVDRPLGRNQSFYMLGSIDPTLADAVMIIPHRHVESPFEIGAAEWADLQEMLTLAKTHLAGTNPDGFTLGWNVGAVGGQTVFHAHLHVISRFADEPQAGRGIRAFIRG